MIVDPKRNVVLAPNVDEDMTLRVDELATNDLSLKRRDFVDTVRWKRPRGRCHGRNIQLRAKTTVSFKTWGCS